LSLPRLLDDDRPEKGKMICISNTSSDRTNNQQQQPCFSIFLRKKILCKKYENFTEDRKHNYLQLLYETF